MIEGKVDAAWARWVRPWTLVAWCFLTAGIALGSALAAPLVIDLARLAEFAVRPGEGGVMEHTAAFFKAPLRPSEADPGGTEHDFHRQMDLLHQYAARHA